MPGIAGIIGTASAKDRASKLTEMVSRMMHESFYSSSTYSDEHLGISLGWVGHAGSFTDCMPVWNETRDICLMFSGEEFTDLAELDLLKARGHEFNPYTASYLVHVYEETGIKFLEKLNGSFSGLLVDLREEKVTLFNDRYGLARIYYHESQDGFYFASEAKALLRILPELRELNMTSLGEVFSCGCPLQNKTIFSGLSILPGGAAWEFARGRNRKREVYFRPECWESQSPLSELKYYDALKETFQRVLPRYHRGAEKVGASLTGGVDSRLIMAWANRPPGDLSCYTFGGMFRDCNDVRIARQVAEICGQPHEVIPVGGEFLSHFHDLAEKTVYLTDGAMDVSGAVDLYANRRARKIAAVRLTGNYGGEIFRSIVAFKPMPMWQGLFSPSFQKLVLGAAETYANELIGRRLSFVAFKQVPWHHYSRLSLELSQLTVRTPYLDNELVALAYQAPTYLTKGNEIFLRLIADGNSDLGKIGTDRSLMLGANSVLDKLRHLYQEFTFRAEYAYDYGMPHWLAKTDNLVRKFHLERLFLGRHKFYHFRLWYRDELSSYVKDMLLDSRTKSRPYLNAKNLETIVRSHTKGHGNYTLEIHRVLTLELIQRLLIES